MSYGHLHHDNHSSYGVTRTSGSRSPTFRKVTKYESDSENSDLENLEGLESEQGYELKDLQASNKRSDQSKADAPVGESDSDDGVPSRLPGDPSGSREIISKSKRYTADEEKAVTRKFDRRLVLFVAFLYMLSFLDRSSKYSIQSTI